MAGSAGPRPVCSALRWYCGQSASFGGDGLADALDDGAVAEGLERGGVGDAEVVKAHPERTMTTTTVQARPRLKAPRSTSSPESAGPAQAR